MGVARLISFGVLLVCVAGCSYIAGVNERAYKNYHASRFDAVLTAYLDKVAVKLPSDPPAPAVCRQSIEPQYKRLISNVMDEHWAWQALIMQARNTISFTGELVRHLDERDIDGIAALTPRISEYDTELELEHEDWAAEAVNLAKQLNHLEALWTDVQPGLGIETSLRPALTRLREEERQTSQNDWRPTLREYHRAIYDRLVERYLGAAEPAGPYLDIPEPEQFSGLSESLQLLETTLAVRQLLDNTIEENLTLLAQLSGVDKEELEFSNLPEPADSYSKPRFAATVARLQVLKSLDNLLTQAADVVFYDVDRAWLLVWPDHDLETNIVTYSNVQQSG
jgi:hypothetical protein